LETVKREIRGPERNYQGAGEAGRVLCEGSENMMILGDYIRRLRESKGLSQRDIRGCSHAQISAIERGTRTASYEMLRLIAQRLNVPVERLELFAMMDGQRGGHKILEKLQNLKDQQQWDELYEMAYKLLQIKGGMLGPVVFAQCEEWVQEAMLHWSDDMMIREDLGAFNSPEEGFRRVMVRVVAGTPPNMLLRYFRYLSDYIDPDHAIYGKIVNNAMFACEQLGDIPQAWQWLTKKHQWARKHQYEWQEMESLATMFRYATMLGWEENQSRLESECRHIVRKRVNYNVWEDYYLTQMWRTWIDDDSVTACIVYQDALRDHDPAWSDMPPWRCLFKAAWELRETGREEPLTQWINHWLQWGWDRWDDQEIIQFMRLAVTIGLGVGHSQADQWWNWLISALRLSHRDQWLIYYQLIGVRLQLDSPWCQSSKEIEWPKWMVTMANTWVEKVADLRKPWKIDEQIW
jgi:transcriptional regulator with XRE-family HTH domain